MRATVIVSHGRWVARCPRPGCMNAEQFGTCDDGTAGGLTGSSFHCRVEYGGCGLTCAADWPHNVDDIERLLRLRPVPATRNWEPGETVEDLLCENVRHGCIPPELLAGEGLLIVDGRISAPAIEAGR